MPGVTVDTNVDINASRAEVWEVLTDSQLQPVEPVPNPGTPEVGQRLVVHMSADGGHGMSFKPGVS